MGRGRPRHIPSKKQQKIVRMTEILHEEFEDALKDGIKIVNWQKPFRAISSVS